MYRSQFHFNSRFFSWLPLLLIFTLITGCASSVANNTGPNNGGSGSVSIDIVVYGASPSGIAAAWAAARMGKVVYVLEPTNHVGGMMSNGLGYTDLYGSGPIGGFSKTFYRNVNSAYNSDPSSFGGYRFEPHVAESVFMQFLQSNSKIHVVRNVHIVSVSKRGTAISSVTDSNGTVYPAREFIDASYTGDLMAQAGVSYTVGRESATQYGELNAGVGRPIPFDRTPVDSYVVAGDASSGLLPHLSNITLGEPGSGDSAVMAYNYRLCLSTDTANQIPFSPPANYNASEFELLKRHIAKLGRPMRVSDVLHLNALPNQKFDLNSGGVISTDEVGASVGYADGSLDQRKAIETEHQRYLQAFLYFISTDSSIAADVRSYVNTLGYCKDEFTDNGGWPHQVYVREARRMIGSFVLTENDLTSSIQPSDSIGVGGYLIDAHATYFVNISGSAYFETHGDRVVPEYAIPYRVLLPKMDQLTNLLVSIDVSASHVAFDSLRVEQTYMIMGQAAGTAAALAINEGIAVQNVDYGSLSAQLSSDGAVLAP